jgi:hypothetical protein
MVTVTDASMKAVSPAPGGVVATWSVSPFSQFAGSLKLPPFDEIQL